MSDAIVALVPAEDYDQERVDAAVRQGIDLLGGIGAFVRPEQKILLKPNLLGRAAPEKAVTTHPAVFSAAAKLLREAGYARLTYGDSPGNPATTPKRAAEGCGLEKVAEQYGIPMADFETGREIRFRDGEEPRSFTLCEGVLEADALINLCKMKTHALERLTGAVKNLYGCICGINKSAGHTQYPTAVRFAGMLADLNRAVKPALHIMDGIVAMEGNGPASGTPVAMKVLLFSADPVALDTVFAHLVHLDPADVPTCPAGAKAGLGVMDAAHIRVLTPEGELTVKEAAAKYGKADFKVDRGRLDRSIMSRVAFLAPLVQPRPRVDRAKCVACGICEEACPVEGKAVHSGRGKKAAYDYGKCIRCYCCQEMCPAKAITMYRPPINRLLGGS